MNRVLRASIFLFAFWFSGQIFSQEYGLVLSGGGGKGAYQVGVWKALDEYGIAQKVTVISGTSVGGLNAALFACEDVDEILYIWKELVPEKLCYDTDEIIDEYGLEDIIGHVRFEKLLQPNSYPRVYVTAVRSRLWILKIIDKWLFDGDYSHRFLLNEEESVDEIKNLLLATSAFPVLTKKVVLKDGYEYVDGGVSDNVPLVPVSDDENWDSIDQILVVYLDSNPKLVSQRYEIVSTTFPDLPIIEFVPSEDLGGIESMVDFSRESVEYLIQLGYNDAVQVLRKAGYRPVSGYWFE